MKKHNAKSQNFTAKAPSSSQKTKRTVKNKQPNHKRQPPLEEEG